MGRTRRKKTHWKRNYARAHNRAVRHKRDFEWRPRKSNPYKQQQDTSGTDLWIFRFKLAVLIATLSITLSIFLFNSFFSISNIQIRGLQRISETEIQEVVQGILIGNRMMMVPGNNYFVVNKNEIASVLSSRYPLEDITVSKEFPNTLFIEIQERISTIIYDNAEEYLYIGLDGRVVEPIRRLAENEWFVETKIVSTTLADGTVRVEEKEVSRTHTPNVTLLEQEMGELPIIYDMRPEKSNGDVYVDSVFVAAYVDWFNILRKETDIAPGYFELVDDFGNSNIVTREGWRLIVSLERGVEEQLFALMEVLRDVPRPNLQYIDLRFDDRVIWR